MSLSWLFARRYLFSRKSTNAINIISAISAFAMGIGTMSLILVLSVFNGFESLVISLYNVFYPEVVVQPAQGKSFSLNDISIDQIREHPDVSGISVVMMENVLVEYNQKQGVVTLKGVDVDYRKIVPNLDSFVIAGNNRLTDTAMAFALVGAGVAYNLGINPDNLFVPLNVYLPRKDAASFATPEQAFNRRAILPGGVFSVQQEFDTRFILVPLSFLYELAESDDEVSQLEIALRPGANMRTAKAGIAGLVGEDFLVKDRFQQNEALYKVMQTEKWVVFAVLMFIIVISAFNIVGALSMLVIEKQNDMAVLLAMGATPGLIRRIFLAEGCLMSGAGAFGGMLLAFILCLLQQYVGIIPMPGQTFLIQYYPVQMQLGDFLWVSAAVIAISLLASWAPASRVSSQAEQVIASMKRF